jgi:hypothetical protein
VESAGIYNLDGHLEIRSSSFISEGVCAYLQGCHSECGCDSPSCLCAGCSAVFLDSLVRVYEIVCEPRNDLAEYPGIFSVGLVATLPRYKTKLRREQYAVCRRVGACGYI